MTTYLITHIFTSLKKNNVSIETFLLNSGENNWKGIMFTIVNIVIEAPVSVLGKRKKEAHTY